MSNLPIEAEAAIRSCVQRELRETIGYELPLLDAYIALASSTLVTSSQLMQIGIRATPQETFPVATEEVHRQRARRLSGYFADDAPGDRFYLLCLAKGYDDVVPLDPPWINEAHVLATAAGVGDPVKAGLISRQNGKHRLVRNPALDERWANSAYQMPKTDFTPNRLEGTPTMHMQEPEPKPVQKTLL